MPHSSDTATLQRSNKNGAEAPFFRETATALQVAKVSQIVDDAPLKLDL